VADVSVVEDTDSVDPATAVRPFVDYTVTPATKLTSSKPRVEKRPSLIQRDGTVLLADKRPFFPVIIEHNGEGFDFLKAIGFNTVELKATASKEQLAEAEALGMWIVCPAPASIGVSDIGFEYDRVLAWSVGRNLKGRDLQTVQQRVREIHQRRAGRYFVGRARTIGYQFPRQPVQPVVATARTLGRYQQTRLGRYPNRTFPATIRADRDHLQSVTTDADRISTDEVLGGRSNRWRCARLTVSFARSTRCVRPCVAASYTDR